MSDREFDNYLTLLATLLRLNPKQRGEIGDELRSHLEDRLDELMARGVAREDAVKQALSEFGDAAGLAGQFLAIQRNRKRRWLMRVTTFSIAATLLFAAGIAIFWPGRNAAPGVAAISAQESAKTSGDKPVLPASRNEEASLQQKLNQRIDADYVETPLKDVVGHLQLSTGIQFYMRTKKLEEASVSPDTPITKDLKDIRLSTLLDLMLDDLALTYVEKDDLILITTPEDAEATMEIRVYDCRDLLAMAAPPGADKLVPLPMRLPSGGMFAVEDQLRLSKGPGPVEITPGAAKDPSAAAVEGRPNPRGINVSTASADQQNKPISEHDLKANRLMQIITNNVDQDSWRDVGGPGSISEFNGLIVVTQAARTHKKIERVLDMLREAAGLEEPRTGKVVR